MKPAAAAGNLHCGKRFNQAGHPGVRLLGVSVSNLFHSADEPLLAFAEEERMQKRNQAVDALKNKYGENIIKRGITGNK